MNAGKRFEAKFRESLNPSTYVLRIPDKTYQFNGHTLSTESEADFVVITDEGTYLIECKATCLKNLPLRNVKEHQEQNLLTVDLKRNCYGLLAVEFYDKESYRKPKRMFLLPIQEWREYKRTTTKKSMPISEFEKRGIEVPFRGNLYQFGDLKCTQKTPLQQSMKL